MSPNFVCVDPECTENTDCPSGEFCNFSDKCETSPCSDDNDICEDDESCVDSVCMTDPHFGHSHRKCDYTSDCPIGEYCDSGIKCEGVVHDGMMHEHDSCTITSDCNNGYNFYCDNGQCEPTNHGDHKHCAITSDCPEYSVCEYGWCVYEHVHTDCDTTSDCSTGF